MQRALAATLTAVLLGGCSGEPGSTGQGPGPTSPATATATATATQSASQSHALSAPPQAASAAELADRLLAAERVVRDPTATRAQLATAAFETQVLYRQLARRPDWQATALADAGAQAPTIRAHLAARGALRGVLTTLSDRLPAWRIVAPTPLEQLRRIYREAGREHGVPWELLAAINFVETGFGKIRGLSSAGAQGPMQFIPETWAAYGEGDVNNPRDAIHAAARYLAARGGAPFDAGRALWAYNQHTGYVEGVQSYTALLRRDPGALRGLHQWQILYLSARGDVWLPVGYRSPVPISVDDYVRRHPGRHLGTDTR